MLANADEFGDWFGVAFKGTSFAAGERVRCQTRGYHLCIAARWLVTLPL